MQFLRIKSGIPGLDGKMEGGFEKGSAVTVSGGPGSGKTIFGIEFLKQGLEEGENCVYLTFEESETDIKNDMMTMGIDAEKYIKSGRLRIVFLSPINFEYLDVLSSLKNRNINRLVVDSVSSLYLYFKNEFEFRKFILDFIRALKTIDITSIMIYELENGLLEANFMSLQYLCDSVISLSYTGMGGEYDRSLRIIKARRTDHYRELIPMKIDHTGLFLK